MAGDLGGGGRGGGRPTVRGNGVGNDQRTSYKVPRRPREHTGVSHSSGDGTQHASNAQHHVIVISLSISHHRNVSPKYNSYIATQRYKWNMRCLNGQANLQSQSNPTEGCDYCQTQRNAAIRDKELTQQSIWNRRAE